MQYDMQKDTPNLVPHNQRIWYSAANDVQFKSYSYLLLNYY